MAHLLRELIVPGITVAIVAHVGPDGDAVGSITALSLALKQFGVVTYPVLRDPVPGAFNFLPESEHIVHDLPMDADYCVVMDMNDISRSGFEKLLRAYAGRKRLITIDHHPKGDLSKVSTEYIHNPNVSSVCEMLSVILPDLGAKLTPDIATCILCGIYTDTGGFQHENATSQTLETASELMKRGARLHEIARYISRTKEISALKLLGIALNRMRVTNNGQCAVSILTYEDLQFCSADQNDIAGIVNEMNGIPGSRLSLLLVETFPGVIRGTVRTGEGSQVRVLTLAKLCGGGGHPKASGFTVAGSVQDNKGRLSIS